MSKLLMCVLLGLLILVCMLPATSCDDESLTFQVISAERERQRSWAGLGPDCFDHFFVTVENTGSQSGWFYVNFTVVVDGKTSHGQKQTYIRPGEWQTIEYVSGSISCSANVNWDYEITTRTD